jgi:hypothetical protein
MAHACSLSELGGRHWRIAVQGLPGQKVRTYPKGFISVIPATQEAEVVGRWQTEAGPGQKLKTLSEK